MKIIAFFGTARAFEDFVREHLEEMDPPREAVTWMHGSKCRIADVLLIINVHGVQSLRGYRGKIEPYISETYHHGVRSESRARELQECYDYIKMMNGLES